MRKRYLFTVETNGRRKRIFIYSKHLSGAVKQLYQMYGFDDFKEVKEER